MDVKREANTKKYVIMWIIFAFPPIKHHRKMFGKSFASVHERIHKREGKIDLPLEVMNLVELHFHPSDICFYNNSLKSHEKLRQTTGGFR